VLEALFQMPELTDCLGSQRVDLQQLAPPLGQGKEPSERPLGSDRSEYRSIVGFSRLRKCPALLYLLSQRLGNAPDTRPTHPALD
jgi:hypothetical protein